MDFVVNKNRQLIDKGKIVLSHETLEEKHHSNQLREFKKKRKLKK
jgi:hypothetical protein